MTLNGIPSESQDRPLERNKETYIPYNLINSNLILMTQRVFQDDQRAKRENEREKQTDRERKREIEFWSFSFSSLKGGYCP